MVQSKIKQDSIQNTKQSIFALKKENLHTFISELHYPVGG